MSSVTIIPANKEDIVRIMAEVDLEVDATPEQMEIVKIEAHNFGEILSDMVMAENLSLTATADGGTPAGAIVSKDLATDFNVAYTEYSSHHPSYADLHALQMKLIDIYVNYQGFEQNSFPTGHTVYVMGYGTLLEYRNKGIESVVHSAALEVYKQIGYQYVMYLSRDSQLREINEELGYKSVFRTSMPPPAEDRSVDLMVKAL